MPVAHQAYKDWSPERIRNWAERIGPNTKQVILAIEHSKAHVQQAQRSSLGILGLQKRYGEKRLERACNMALTEGCYSVKFIRTILQNGRDKVIELVPHQPMPQHHDNIRGADYYN